MRVPLPMHSTARLATCIAFVVVALPLGAGATHPVHISNTNVELARDSRSLEITVRMFSDDLEEAIVMRGAPPARFGTAPAPLLDSLLSVYLRDRLRIGTDDGMPHVPRLLGHERDGDAIRVYLELAVTAPPRRVRLQQRVFLDRFDDQTNLVHVRIGATRRSALLRRGQDQADLAF